MFSKACNDHIGRIGAHLDSQSIAKASRKLGARGLRSEVYTRGPIFEPDAMSLTSDMVGQLSKVVNTGALDGSYWE